MASSITGMYYSWTFQKGRDLHTEFRSNWENLLWTDGLADRHRGWGRLGGIDLKISSNGTIHSTVTVCKRINGIARKQDVYQKLSSKIDSYNNTLPIVAM